MDLFVKMELVGPPNVVQQPNYQETRSVPGTFSPSFNATLEWKIDEAAWAKTDTRFKEWTLKFFAHSKPNYRAAEFPLIKVSHHISECSLFYYTCVLST